MPLRCGLRNRQTSIFQGFHIAVETHSCDISSESMVHPLGNAPCIPTLKPSPFTPILHHSSCLPDIQTPFLQAVFHGINPSLLRSTHWATTNTLPYIDLLAILLFSILSIWPNHRRMLWTIFSFTPFVTPHNCLIRAFGTLSILLLLSKPLRLSICTA